MEIEVQYIITNEYGIYKGEVLIINQEQYDKIIDLSKNFYENGFELYCEDGSFVIFPPDIIRRSILKINKKILKEDV